MWTGRVIFILAVLLVFATSKSTAREPVAIDGALNYYRCIDLFSQESIQSVLESLNKLIDRYNEQFNVDVRMQKPSQTQCYYIIGQPDTIMSKIQSVRYYIDSEHFQCELNGACVGNRKGYIAGGSVRGEDMMIELKANAGARDDLVRGCLSSAGLSRGPCN